MLPEPSDPHEARTILDDVRQVRRRTQRARRSFWFPLVLFGLLTLASSPLYVLPAPGPTWRSSPPSSLGYLSGQTNSGDVGLFWLIALPAGYALTAGYYWWRAHRRGVRTPWHAYAMTSGALLTLLAVLLSNALPRVEAWTVQVVPPDLIIRGLLPLLAMAAGFGALAVAQRSAEFGVFATVFTALCVVANLYDLGNITDRVGLGGGGNEVNTLVVGCVLVAAGVYFALRERGLAIRIQLRWAAGVGKEPA